MQWIIRNNDTAQETIGDNGNRLLVGNGYLGIRGTLDEQGKEQLAAINLAGIYDQVGDGWREPLNAPNPLYTYITVNGERLALPQCSAEEHEQSLDYRYGIYSRQTTWNTTTGSVTVESRRFAHMTKQHMILHQYRVTVSAPMSLELTAAITGDIWEIYGPHYNQITFSEQGGVLLCLADVQNGKDHVAVGRRCELTGCNAVRTYVDGAFNYLISLQPNETAVLTSYSAIYTTLDDHTPLTQVCTELEAPNYDDLLDSHISAWEKIWTVGKVELDGDDEAQNAINYSLYHLNSIAPRHSDSLSIAARGLSGQVYKGAIFWDSEMFILDYFLYTQPKVARAMVRYRIDTLDGALQKAREYGWEGAFYAWESQEGGYEGCSDYNIVDVFTKRPMRTFFRDKQVHVSSAIARAIIQYVKVTGDITLLAQGGAKTILECARFYFSLLLGRSTVDRWEIHDVVGPDEYHERVNNNAYTNKMAHATIRWALESAALLEREDAAAYDDFCKQTNATEILPKLKSVVDKIYIPQPNVTGLIEQFDGYFGLEDASIDQVRNRLLDPKEYWGGAYGVAAHTQVLKQADVVAMLEMFHNEYPREILKANLDYYSPRTEHGSSLSACMYGLLSCRCGEPNIGYPFFMKSAKADWAGGCKQWAGLIYIGGTHPASAGGAWKVLAQGFAGLDITEDGPVVHPCLPDGWKRLAMHIFVRGKQYRVEVTRDSASIQEVSNEI